MAGKLPRQRGLLNQRFCELVDGGVHVDVGTWLEDLIDRRKFPQARAHRNVLRYGPTERIGYELLERSQARVVLYSPDRRQKAKKPSRGMPADKPRRIQAMVERASFEPVPIETVLWDGQGSQTSSQADWGVFHHPELELPRPEALWGREPLRPKPKSPAKPGAAAQRSRKPVKKPSVRKKR